MVAAIRAADFIGTLGVNTHIDFANYGYQNLSAVEAAINYLDLKNLRDSPQWSGDVGSGGSWQQVASATGAKFDAYIPEGSPANMQASLNLIPQLAQQGILNFIEGGNEEDDAYAASLGNTLQITADFQKNSVWAMGQALGLPVINMSFGSGWTAANGWMGDYASVGDLANYATYGNAHSYPVSGQTPDSTIQRINGLAKLADSGDPVITTEIGWDRNQGYSQKTVAKFVLAAAMDGIKDGDTKMYFYALFDDGSGSFGLMNQDGTPMPAGTAIHSLTTLLSDAASSATSFSPGSLNYSLSNTTANDNSLLFQKSDGTYWISLWNEVDGAHAVTVNLPSAAAEIKVFDPLTGVSAIQDVTGASSVTVGLSDHPVLVEVVPSTTPPSSVPPSVTTGSGSNDLILSMAEDAYQGDARFTVSVDGQQLGGTFTTTALQSTGVTQNFIFNGNWSAGSHTVTVNFINDAYDGSPATDRNLYVDGVTYDGTSTGQTAALYANGPRSFTVGDTTPVGSSPGSVTTGSGPDSLVLSMAEDAWQGDAQFTVSVDGVQLGGTFTTTALQSTGTTQTFIFNGDWSTGTQSVTVTFLNDAYGGSPTTDRNLYVDGVTYDGTKTAQSAALYANGSKTFSVNDTTPSASQNTTMPSAPVTPSAPVIPNSSTPQSPTMSIASTDASPVVNDSNVTIIATTGDHSLFIGGTHDTAILTGGTEMVQAYQGYNTITTGSGDDTIRIAGSGNVIDAGAGSNRIEDSGSWNTLVMPANGQDDVFGYVIQNGDTIDLREALKATAWDGQQSTLGNFVHVGLSANDAIISVTATANGATTGTMDLHDSGALSLSDLLAQAITA